MDNRDSQITEIKSQISHIKNVMNISSSTFRMIYAAENFRTMFILSGIFSLLLPAIYQVLLLSFNSHQQIPRYLLIGFYAAIFVCWLVLIIVRTIASQKAAKELGINDNLFGLVKRILKTKMWIAVIPVLAFLIAVPLKFSSAFDTFQMVSYYGVVLGITLNMIGVMINEREYCVAGAWAMVSGAVLLFIVSCPVHIAFAIILAPTAFLFVIVNSMLKRRKESENEIG